jgi:hypothetical protein
MPWARADAIGAKLSFVPGTRVRPMGSQFRKMEGTVIPSTRFPHRIHTFYILVRWDESGPGDPPCIVPTFVLEVIPKGAARGQD